MKRPSSFKYNISNENIQIVDSYKVKTSADMQKVLTYLRRKKEMKNNNVLTSRTDKSMIVEWRAHNFLYFFHIYRAHTNDVDLDINPSNKIMSVGYRIMSMLYNLIIPFYKYK